jgi:hypothetical protein
MLSRILLVSLSMLIGAALGQALTANASAPAGVVPVQFCDGTNCASMNGNAVMVSP